MSGGSEATWSFPSVVQWPINHSDGGTNEQHSLNALPVCVLAPASVCASVLCFAFLRGTETCACLFLVLSDF